MGDTCSKYEPEYREQCERLYLSQDVFWIIEITIRIVVTTIVTYKIIKRDQFCQLSLLPKLAFIGFICQCIFYTSFIIIGIS